MNKTLEIQIKWFKPLIKNGDIMFTRTRMITERVQAYPVFLDSTKLKTVWTKTTTFFKRRVSTIL